MPLKLFRAAPFTEPMRYTGAEAASGTDSEPLSGCVPRDGTVLLHELGGVQAEPSAHERIDSAEQAVLVPTVPHGSPEPSHGQRPDSARRRFRLSIGLKLALLISGLQLALVVGLSLYFESQQIDALRTRLRNKADTYAQLVSAQVRSAVAFEDKETAREVFDSLSRDPDLLAAVLFDADGHEIHAWGAPGKVAQAARGGVLALKVFTLPDRLLAVAPVVSLEGPRGTLTLEVSLAELVRSRAELERAAVLAGVIAMLLGGGVVLLIARSLARRIGLIANVAEKVAGGDLTQSPANDAGSDEIGSLARSFGAMLAEIKRLFAEREAHAAEEQSRLEGLVRQRTLALEGRNLDMRCVLDNVGQGFLTIDKNGIMSSERSAVVERWLGRAPDSGSLWQYIDSVAPDMGQRLEVGWDEVVSGFLPRELSLEQMPRRFSLGERHFALEYKPILTSGDDFERAIVVLSDITPVVERERAEVEQRDALRLFLHLNEDRAGVLEFIAEAKRLVHEITVVTAPDPLITRRLIHTLKGNASVFGIERLSRLCHVLEDGLAESNADLGAAERRLLRATWDDIDTQLSPLIGEREQCTLTIGEQEYQQLLQALSGGGSVAEIRQQVESWRLESTEVRLKRAGRQAAALAERLGKAPLEVHVESNQIRLDPQLWSEVWTEFPHLIRNAIDHGLEDSAERVARGKTGAARLCLRTFVEASSFVIEVEDTGRGVDWERVRAIASARGLPTATQSDLERALFADGLSTKERVEETSGRGIGMAAMAAAVHARGGHIQVRSQTEFGTRVRMSWPVTAANARSMPAPEGPPSSKRGP